MNHWIRPSCDSRTGASHLRRGAPCQDASGFVGFRDAAGSPIQVLVVSDGHGGARYVRSDVGARLACEVAMRELRQALAPARVAHPGALEDWRQRLSAELPGRIVAAWRREVEAHWRSDPSVDGSPFSPLLYGATLGVLLLTPAWWAHTGLGDWDLVWIEAAGGEALLSEEPEREAGGEATFSLCLERAERQFAARTVLQPLTTDQAPFALLLCSDGLRKSCGSDADFLTLCRYLEGLCPSAEPAAHPAACAELAEALDHISRQGSGDDISVAVARWAPAQRGPAWPQPGWSAPATLVQPLPGPASGPPHPASAPVAQTDAPTAVSLAAAPTTASDARLPAHLAPADPGRPEAPARLRRGRRGSARPLLLLAAGLVLGAAALLVAAGRGLGPFATRPESPPLLLTPQQRSDLRRQVQQLCERSAGPPAAPVRAGGLPLPAESSRRGLDPAGARPETPSAAAPAGAASQSRPGGETALPATLASATPPRPTTAPVADPRRLQRITATLATRDSVFLRLASGDPAAPGALLRQSHVDPLSALIAVSAGDAGLGPAPSPADPPAAGQPLGRRLVALLPWATPARRPAVASPLAQLGACPELRLALQARWQRLRGDAAASRGLSPAVPSAGSPAPAPGRRGDQPAFSGASPAPAAGSR